MVEIAIEKKIVAGRRMRVDTTVVETNIHYTTDSSLPGDGARVLTRVMKKPERAAGGLMGKVRNRMRTVRKKVVAIAIAARQRGAKGEEKRRGVYKELLTVTRKIVNQAKRAMAEVDGFGHRRKKRFAGMRGQLATMVERVEQVARQTRARIFGGDTKFDEKIVSMFEPQTEIIRKGKASKPAEFGKMLKVQEAENQIVTHFEVYEERPADSDLLVKSVEIHKEQTGKVPRIVAADAGFYSRANEKNSRRWDAEGTVLRCGVSRPEKPPRSHE